MYGSIDPELSQRINKESRASIKFGMIRTYQFSTDQESSVLTILLYTAEAWQTNKLQIHRLEKFHQSCLMKILRVKFFNHVTNSKILQRKSQSQVRLLVAIRRLRCLDMCCTWMMVAFLNTCWNRIQGKRKEHERGKGQPGSAALKKIWRWSQEELE